MIFARDGWRCIYCGKKVCDIELKEIKRPLRLKIFPRDEKGRLYQVDHIIPVSKCGDSSFNNLGTSCYECNIKKSDKYIKPKYHFFKIKNYE